MSRWDIVADVSDLAGEEVGIDMVPHPYYSDDGALTADQPAVRAGHYANEAAFIIVQALNVGAEIRACRGVMTSALRIMRSVIVEHLQENIL